MNPYINAILAVLYIVGIVYVIQDFTSIVAIQKTLLIPIGMLGLFVLSAAVMAFLFMYKPFQLYFDGRQEDALRFFFKTLVSFACFVGLYLGYLSFLLG